MSKRLLGRLRTLVAALPSDYWFLWLGTLVNRLGGFVAPFLALYLTSARGFTVAHAALVVALFGAGSFAASLAGGTLSDRFGRRPVMLTSFFVSPAFVMLLGLLRDLPVITACTFLLGFFTDLYRPAVSSSVADIVPRESRPRAYGYLYWAINLGAAIAPVVAGFVAHISFLPLFVADAATTFAYGLIVLLRVHESRPEAHGDSSSEPGEGARRRRVRSPLRLLKRDPLLLFFSGLSLLSAMVYAQAYSTFPMDMLAHHAGASDYGLAIAVNGIVIVLLGIPAGHSAGRWHRLGAMSAASLLFGVGFGMNGLFHVFGLYLLAVVVWSIGEIVSASVAPTIIADMAPAESRGLYQGVAGASWGLAFFLGPALGGWVLQRWGSSVLWGACFLLGVVVALGYLAVSAPASRRISTRSIVPFDAGEDG